MICSKVAVPWQEGLHVRHAAALVRVAQCFRSTIHIACGGKIAELLSILTLCATMGTVLEVQTIGEDESDAAAAIEEIFSASTGDTDSGGDTASR